MVFVYGKDCRGVGVEVGGEMWGEVERVGEEMEEGENRGVVDGREGIKLMYEGEGLGLMVGSVKKVGDGVNEEEVDGG